MKKPIAFAAIAAVSVLLLAGCGNKGPLVRPSDIPPPAPPASEPAPAVAPAPAPAMPAPPADDAG